MITIKLFRWHGVTALAASCLLFAATSRASCQVVTHSDSLSVMRALGSYAMKTWGPDTHYDPDIKCATAAECKSELRLGTRGVARERRAALSREFAAATNASSTTLRNAMACTAGHAICPLRGLGHFLQVREPVFRSDSAATIVVRVLTNHSAGATPERSMIRFKKNAHGQWVYVSESVLPIW